MKIMRLIDADRLSNKLHDHEFAMLCPLDEVDGVIDCCSTVDAIEVVRCGECKYYDNPVCTLLSEMPSQYGSGNVVEMEYSDFCSYGERKE